MKKLIKLAMSALTAVGLASVASAEIESGSCGMNLTWTLDTTTKALVISGSGTRMNDYDVGDRNPAPWYGKHPSTIGFETPNLTYIGDEAFFECSITTLTNLPPTLTEIGYGSFRYCRELTKVRLPDSVTAIGGESFSSCPLLEEIYLGTSLTKLPQYVFDADLALRSITIPETVTEIEENAFFRAGLTSVTIPAAVTNIGKAAFDNCESLTSVVCEGAVPPTVPASGVFGGCSADLVITVPLGSEDSYKVAWPNVGNKIHADVPADCLSGPCGTDLAWVLNTNT